MIKEHSRESVGTVERSVDTKLLNTRHAEGICMVVTQTKAKKAILEMAASTRHAISVE